MSLTNQRLNAAEAERRLSEFDWNSGDSQKLEEILGLLGTRAESERKAKYVVTRSSLDPRLRDDLEELVRREEGRLNDLWTVGEGSEGRGREEKTTGEGNC